VLALARERLIPFACVTLPGYRPAPHLARLAEALEAVERGEIRRLMVWMPPRHGKSELASIRFPAWYLGRNPDRRVVLAAYGADLAQRFSRFVRATIEGPQFRCVFPGIGLCPDSRAVDSWDIAGRRGGLKAAGVGGPLTGHGANLLIIDDPLKNREEADSQTIRQAVWDWYTSTAYTRLEENGAIVLIQTRWHEDDLSGRLLAAQGTDARADEWTIVHMPAIDGNGRPLWPERYPLEELERIRANVGPRDWEALYQGRPAPPEGSVFRLADVRIEDRAPAHLRLARGWDLAASSRTTADWTVGALCGIDGENRLWVLDVYRRRQSWPETVRDMAALAQLEPGTVWAIERAGFQLAAVQQLRADPRFNAMAIRGIEADRDKVARALAWSGRPIHLVRASWNQEFIAELVAFPQGQHDDQVDAVSTAWAALARLRPPASATVEERGWYAATDKDEWH